MRKLTVLPLALALAMVGAQTTAQADAFKPSKTEQVKLGKRAAEELRSKERVLPSSDERVRILRKVASRLLSVADDGKDPWEYSFDVIQSKEVNAFALPGGPTFFYTGLMDRLSTEDQLAGVLAHELTHVRREHWAYQYADAQKRNLGLSALLIIFRANNNVANAASVLNDVAFGLKFSRKHEQEADERGMDLMVQAGYNPQGMKEVFEILSRVSGGGNPPEWLSNHPSDKSRISNMQNRITKMNRTFPAQRPLPWAK